MIHSSNFNHLKETSIYFKEAAFEVVANELLQNENGDLSTIMTIASLSLAWHARSSRAIIWSVIKKIYDDSQSNLSKKEIKQRIYADHVNVTYKCLKDENWKYFKMPTVFKLTQIAFLHSCARSIYEYRFWKSLEVPLQRENIIFKTIPDGWDVMESALKSNLFHHSLSLNEKETVANLIDFPEIATEEAVSRFVKSNKLEKLYFKIIACASVVDTWITHNKTLLPKVKFFRYGSGCRYFNRISVLPFEFFNLVNLESINLDHNAIKKLPSEFMEFKQLKRLSFKFNCFNDFPSLLCNMTTLEYMDLSGNKISSIPVEIGNLKKLKYLILSSNQIRSISESIGDLQLKSLNLTMNPISLADLPNNLKIKNLYLTHK